MNVIFLSLKKYYLKHLLDIMGVGKIINILVREVIAKVGFKKKSGNKYYLLKDK